MSGLELRLDQVRKEQEEFAQRIQASYAKRSQMEQKFDEMSAELQKVFASKTECKKEFAIVNKNIGETVKVTEKLSKETKEQKDYLKEYKR